MIKLLKHSYSIHVVVYYRVWFNVQMKKKISQHHQYFSILIWYILWKKTILSSIFLRNFKFFFYISIFIDFLTIQKPIHQFFYTQSYTDWIVNRPIMKWLTNYDVGWNSLIKKKQHLNVECWIFKIQLSIIGKKNSKIKNEILSWWQIMIAFKRFLHSIHFHLDLSPNKYQKDLNQSRRFVFFYNHRMVMDLLDSNIFFFFFGTVYVYSENMNDEIEINSWIMKILITIHIIKGVFRIWVAICIKIKKINRQIKKEVTLFINNNIQINQANTHTAAAAAAKEMKQRPEKIIIDAQDYYCCCCFCCCCCCLLLFLFSYIGTKLDFETKEIEWRTNLNLVVNTHTHTKR